MAIQREFYGERADGVKLYRTFSDSGGKVRQKESGIIYGEAVDPENSGRSYEEIMENEGGL